MDHDHIRLALAGYLDQSLEPKERAAVEEHLKTCASCTASLTELKEMLDQARQLDRVASPPWMTQKIMARVREKAEKRESKSFGMFVRLRFAVQVLGVVFLAFTAFLFYSQMRPEERVIEQTQPTPPPKLPRTEKNSRPLPDVTRQVPQQPSLEVPSQRTESNTDKSVPVPERPVDSLASKPGPSEKLLLVKIRSQGNQSVAGIEEAIRKAGGTIINTDRQNESWAVTLQIDESKHTSLLNALRVLGRAEERILAIDGREGREILMSTPKAAVGC